MAKSGKAQEGEEDTLEDLFLLKYRIIVMIVIITRSSKLLYYWLLWLMFIIFKY